MDLIHDHRRMPQSVSRLNFWRRSSLGAALVAAGLLLGACSGDPVDQTTPSPLTSTAAGSQDADPMGGMGEVDHDVPRVPPVFAYYDGQEIFFIHTEVSDQAIADILVGMMDSPVPVVASLAEVPDGSLGIVYVFTNGVAPDDSPLGPLGFQPDVFDSAPGDSEYTPLRRIVQVTWDDGAQPTVLTSVGQIEQAESRGELMLAATDVVVNAPFLTWPGGGR